MRTCPLSARTCYEPECEDGCCLERAERAEAEWHKNSFMRAWQESVACHMPGGHAHQAKEGE